MQVRVPNKKKQRIIIASTVVGVLLVTVIWGFQIHTLFTTGLAKEVSETQDEASDTIKELDDFRVQVEQQMPMITTSISEITEMFKSQMEQQQAQEQAQLEAEQQLEGEAVNSVVAEALERINEQNPQEDQ